MQKKSRKIIVFAFLQEIERGFFLIFHFSDMFLKFFFFLKLIQ